MKERRKFCPMGRKHDLAFVACFGFLLVSALLSLCLGAVPIPLSTLWQSLLFGPGDTAGAIFWYARLPRTCGSILAGAALACSGWILQNVLGNKLASPSTIGVNAGSGLAVTVCCALGLYSGWCLSLAAFGGALAAALAVLVLAQKTGASRTTVVLSGVALNSILNALRDALTTLVPEAGMLGSDFRVGGFSAVSTQRLLPAAILILTALVVCFFLHNELDLLVLGEETAQSLGLSVKKIRWLFLLLAAVLAGAAVSFAGLLSFVGLMVPHMVRQWAGNISKVGLPLCALLGGGLVTACDLLSRLIFAPFELPVGILISLIGGPFFLMLLFQRKGGRNCA